MRRACFSTCWTRAPSAGAAALVLGAALGCERAPAPRPRTVAPPPAGRVGPFDVDYVELARAAEAITDAIESARLESRQLDLIDYISPDEMLRDLRGGHGADCDRPDLDRRMIEELSRRRR